jgi:methylphosphotriester-DNA--protein-cysteine methyltransferase
VLVHDPLVPAVLQGRPPDLSARTIRHRFLRATGLTHAQVVQYERAQRAAALLEQGASIPDAVFAAGYSDQPHLTRSLKRWVGHTPGEIVRARAMAGIAD